MAAAAVALGCSLSVDTAEPQEVMSQGAQAIPKQVADALIDIHAQTINVSERIQCHGERAAILLQATVLLHNGS